MIVLVSWIYLLDEVGIEGLRDDVGEDVDLLCSTSRI